MCFSDQRNAMCLSDQGMVPYYGERPVGKLLLYEDNFMKTPDTVHFIAHKLKHVSYTARYRAVPLNILPAGPKLLLVSRIN